MHTAMQIVSIAAGVGGLWLGSRLASDYARKLKYPHRAADKTILVVLAIGPGLLAYCVTYEVLTALG